MALPWLDLWCAPSGADGDHGEATRARRSRRDVVRAERSASSDHSDDSTRRPSSRLQLADDLAERLRSRDEAAYRELVHQTAPALVRFAASMVRSRDVAHDVVQDVFVRLWHRSATLELHGGSLADYLFRAVRNGALTALRNDVRAVRAREAFERDHRHDSPGTAFDADETPWERELTALRAVLATLTEHQRAAVALRYGEGMPLAQVARILEVSEKGAEQLLVRVRKLVRTRILALMDPPM